MIVDPIGNRCAICGKEIYKKGNFCTKHGSDIFSGELNAPKKEPEFDYNDIWTHPNYENYGGSIF